MVAIDEMVRLQAAVAFLAVLAGVAVPQQAGNPQIRRMDSGTEVRERTRVVSHFAPHANNRIDIAGSEQEIDILISTDVLSEGQNRLRWHRLVW